MSVPDNSKERIVVTMTRDQAYATMAATELLARLHIGQFKEVTWKLINRLVDENGKFDAKRRDMADAYLEQACREIFGTTKNGSVNISAKSIEHNRCWAVYATIRHALAWHDHPEGGYTVNFDEPLPYGEPMPKCEIKEE